IRADVESAFAAPPNHPAAWLEGYALQFAHDAAGQARDSGCAALTAGEVVAYAYLLREELWEATLDLTEVVIRDAVRWVGRRVVGWVDGPLEEWAAQELLDLGASLWFVLAAGSCHCWEGRWQPLSLQSQEHAAAYCAGHHRLARWAGGSLDDFLFRAF